MKLSYTVLVKTVCLFLVASFVLLGLSHFTSYSVFPFAKEIADSLALSSEHNHTGEPTENTTVPSTTHDPTTPATESNLPLKDGNRTLLAMAPAYIAAIMNPSDTSFPRLECQTPSGARYEYMRDNSTSSSPPYDPKILPKYFFAVDLHQCVQLLPRLIGTIIETMRFLGPENCALSIVEGRSDDGTFEILLLLRAEVEALGARYIFTSSDLNPTVGDRIAALAALRNLALAPLTSHRENYAINTRVIFLTDVALCRTDILELLHQQQLQNATMVCAMDWVYVGPDPTFYDVWIARGMNGDSFFNIPPDGNWDSAWNLFWNDQTTLQMLHNNQPFQVFSCWNGAVVFDAMPLFAPAMGKEDQKGVKFRSSTPAECHQGEPKLFCKDLWAAGYGKIAVVPSVNIEYSDDNSRRIKQLKGFVETHVSMEANAEEPKIEWDPNPPENVKCMTTYANQIFVPWNEGL